MMIEPKSTHNQPAQVVSGIEQTVVHVPRLTVKRLADKLVEIEKNKGYEVARLGVESLDYVKICHLCLEKHPDDDPHLMPSRFMILYGATDEGLKKKGNLDKFPYEQDSEKPHEMSVEGLSRLLGIMGWNQATWMTDDDDDALEEDGKIPESEKAHSQGLVGHLFGALCAYIDEAVPAPNQDVPGDGTDLQDAESNPLVLWFQDNGWDDDLDPRKGYRYPGKYLRLSISGQDEDATDAPDRTCEVYLPSGTRSLLYRLDLQGTGDLKLVVPDTPDIAVALGDSGLEFRGRTWPRWDDYLARGEGPADEATA